MPRPVRFPEETRMGPRGTGRGRNFTETPVLYPSPTRAGRLTSSGILAAASVLGASDFLPSQFLGMKTADGVSRFLRYICNITGWAVTREGLSFLQLLSTPQKAASTDVLLSVLRRGTVSSPSSGTLKSH